MSIFAIADLHLSGAVQKPMDIFGHHWQNHWELICEAWLESVTNDDIVLIPGDISWAMRLEQALVDLRRIAELPGKKILLRGNHDYWWSSPTKIRGVLPKDMYIIQNDAVRIGDFVFFGSRGWICEGSPAFSKDDEKIYQREGLRLEMSLEDARKKGGEPIAMMHFPPFNERQEPSLFTRLFERERIKIVLYGHIHGKSLQNAFSGELNGVEYMLVSCDNIAFKPLKIIA
jgi:predicted phosphohydrolase